MQLDSLVIDPADAEARLDEYRTQLATERTAEDEAIAAGYRAAARGLPVISLKAAFQTAGTMTMTDRRGGELPRLAIARADATEVWVDRSWHFGGWLFTTIQRVDYRGALVGRQAVRVPVETPLDGVQRRGRTVVPTIPPRHRPRLRRLRGFHVLWEVEAWDPTPPADPALLRHIRGDLWAVQAVWDLTPLERAVLAQRSTP